MATLAVTSPLWLDFADTSVSIVTRTIGNAVTSKQKMIFTSPITGTITRIAILVTANTTVSGQLLRYGFQNVVDVANSLGRGGDASGTFTNSATVDASGFDVYNANVLSGMNILTGLNQSVVKGQRYALVMEPNTAWGAGNNVSVRASLSGLPFTASQTWYSINAATLPQNSGGVPCYAIGTSTQWYGFPSVLTAPTFVEQGAVGGTTQCGFRFRLPTTITSAKISDLWFQGFKFGFGTGTLTPRILDYTTNTTLQSGSASVDAAHYRTTQLTNPIQFSFTDTLATLTPGVTYAFIVEASNGANIGFNVVDLDTDTRTAWENQWGCISNVNFIRRGATSGPWTEINTYSGGSGVFVAPVAKIQFTDITTASGSGGGMIVHPGMAGGMRG
jgi:hypothetical protein